ncbi:MAG TPA: hypothetical protein VMT53_04795 [Terriglobales bacterium]|nr:hypothetical protein [Terriglobales bacterium]
MKFLDLFFAGALCLSAVRGFALDRNAFTFTHYYLNIRVEPEQQRLAVRGKLTLRNDSTLPQRNAVLQISSSLDWRSIRVGGSPVQFIAQTYTSDIDHTGALSEAILTLPHEVAPHATVDVDVGYEGIIPLDGTRLTRIGVPEGNARQSDWDHIGPSFSAVRGIGYVTWYPIATEAANLSDANSVFETVGDWKARQTGSEMVVSFSTSSKQEVLASGTPTRSTVFQPDPSDSSKYSSYQLSDLGITAPVFLIGDYKLLEKAPLCEVYYLPGHEKAASMYSEEAAKVDEFVTWLGSSREPVRTADLADSTLAPFESGDLMVMPLSTDLALVDINLAHAFAHAHFRSPRPWINEGLAHFVQALWREQQSGRQAALDFMGLHRTALAAAEKIAGEQKNSSPAQSLITTTDEEYYRSKAMFVWWMLHDMLGDTVFKKAVAAYEPQRDTQPSYVQKLFETQSHRDLEWFFDDWVYRDRGLPDFRVASAYARQLLNGTYMVTVTVENLGAAGAEVPVRVRIGGGDISSRLEVHGKSSASVRIEAPSSPQEITVNDGSVPESSIENNNFQVQQTKK